MTVKVSKSAINVREELADLKKPTGIAGEAMLRAETPQEQFNLIGAGRRNLIINGGMQVAQRGTSSQKTGSTVGYETVDRFICYTNSYSSLVATQSQSTDAPSGSGFSNSFKINVDTAESAPTNGFIDFRYKSESQDMQSLAYGTSSAKTMTLSFWVKSNVTGTYNISFYIDDAVKTYNVSYTIDAAGTWEHKTVQVTGNTNSGQGFNNDNGVGIYVSFTLSAGTNYKGSPSTNAWGAYSAAGWGGNQTADIGGTASNYWQVTGVQLELGKVATPFEHARSYGEELALCQRYFYKITGGGSPLGSGIWYANNQVLAHFSYPQIMRAAPEFTTSGVNFASCYTSGAARESSSGIGFDNIKDYAARINVITGANGSAGDGTYVHLTNSASISISAEL